MEDKTGKIMARGMIGVVGAVMVVSMVSMFRAKISGIAYDCYGAGVEGVAVSLGGVSVVTGSDGLYSLETFIGGAHTITFAKNGYYPVSRIVNLTVGSEVLFNAPMLETIIDPTGTVLCLPMSEGAGFVAMDVSGYGNDALLGGGDAARVPAWSTLPDGKRCLLYDGEDDCAKCAAAVSLNLTDVITVVATITPLAPVAPADSNSVLKRFTSLAEGYELMVDNTPRLRLFSFVGGVNLGSLESTTTLVYGSRYQVGFIWKSNGYRALVVGGGVESSTPTTYAIPSMDVSTFIGWGNSWWTSRLRGPIDQLRVYNRELTVSEFAALNSAL